MEQIDLVKQEAERVAGNRRSERQGLLYLATDIVERTVPLEDRSIGLVLDTYTKIKTAVWVD